MKVMPVQKQTTAGQRMRMKCWVLVGDGKGHVGLGSKAHKELQIAIQAATNRAKMSILPVRMGYWGNKINQPHTVPMKVSGKEGSVRVRLVPAPRGTGIVAPYASKKVLEFAGVVDCYTQSVGCTRTKGNFLFATFNALANTANYLTPEFWGAEYVESKDKHVVEEDDENDQDDL
jgi:ribosomal protein uS5